MFGEDTFVSKWMDIKPCNSRQADYITMKMSEQKKKCGKCKAVYGCNMCDIYTSCEEEARLGKYLIEQKIRGEI